LEQSVRGVDCIRIVRPDVPPDEWRYWANRAQAFSGLAAQRSGAARIGGRMVFCDFVSANYFLVLNVPMLIGSGFTERGDAPNGADNSAIISYRLWQVRFGGDANVIGRVITVERIAPGQPGLSFIVVGVARPDFEGPDRLRRQVKAPPLGTDVNRRRRRGAKGGI
jgi:hypothetical protein